MLPPRRQDEVGVIAPIRRQMLRRNAVNQRRRWVQWATVPAVASIRTGDFVGVHGQMEFW